MNESGNITRCTCPRCGYDLRGPIDTWLSCCPLNGTCNECGLEFQWRNIFDPDRQTRRWHVESAHGGRVPMAVVLTLARMLWPRRFWRVLEMHDPVCPARMLLLLIPVLALMYGELSAVRGVTSAARARGSLAQAIRTNTVNALGDPYETATWTIDTLSKAARRAQRTRWFELPTRVDALSLPAVTLIVMIPLCPLAYLLLPQSLRAARVRRAHLGRIAAYSILAIPAWFLPLACYAARMQPGPNPTTTWPIWCVFGLSWLWMASWWGCATKYYLHLPHPHAVALLTTLLGALAFIAALWAWNLMAVVMS